MLCFPQIRVILFVLGCLLLSLLSLHAHTKEEWEEQVKTILADEHISDSLKIMKVSRLTLDYGVYYRIVDAQVLEKYFEYLSPLIHKYDRDEWKVYFYRPVFYIASDPESEESFTREYTGFIENSQTPLVRYAGWMTLAKSNINKSIALSYLFNALNEVKGSRNMREQAEVNQYISFYYGLQGNHANQLKYALVSVEQARNSGDVGQLIASLKDLGAAYYEDPEQQWNEEALEAYNEARKLFIEKVKIRQLHVRSFESLQYMEVLVTLGSIYQSRKQSLPAINYLNEALHIARQNNFSETEAFCHKELGILYQSLKNYREAEDHYLTAWKILEEYSLHTLEINHIQYEVQLQLANLYHETGRYREAAAYYEAGIRKYRRMFDEEIMNEKHQVAAYYEALKQEEDIAGLKSIVALKEKQKYYYWGIMLVLLFMLWSVFRLYHYRIRHIKQREEQLRNDAMLLDLDRSKAALQSRLKQEEAQYLHQKLLMGDGLLDHKNKIFENVKRFIAENSELQNYRQSLENILMQQDRVENNMDELTTGLKDVPIDFYVRLQKRAGNKLTPLDMKYCRFIYLNVPSNEMARLLFVDPKTIRVGKYRLKQKLNLSKEDDLSMFIRQIINRSKNE